MTTPLWTSGEITQATKGILEGAAFTCSGISIDTRSLKEGDLFVALKGEQQDGHKFLEQAIEKGAAGALVSQQPEGECAIPVVVVKDTLKALTDLASHRRRESKAKLVGVTGSVGKTSVKQMLSHVLDKQGKTAASEGNLNNHIGVPLSLARLPKEAEYGVFELGMNHAGEIRELTKLLRPHVAVITGIEAVHLEFFDSLKGIAEAKAEIFEGVVEGGGAVVPFDTDFLPMLAGAANKAGVAVDNIISFGVGEDAAIRLVGGKEELRSQELRAAVDGKEYVYRMGMVGRHQALNSLAVIAVVKLLGGDIGKAVDDLGSLRPSEGRGRLFAAAAEGKSYLLMDDSYNASPASIRASLRVLKLARGRKVAVLGDMLELGKAEKDLHAALAEDILRCGIDKVFTAGKRMKALHDALPEGVRGEHVASALDLQPVIKAAIEQGDTVLVKGSHGSEMYKLAEVLRKGR